MISSGARVGVCLLCLAGCDPFAGSPPPGAPDAAVDAGSDAGPDAHLCTLIGCGAVATLTVAYDGPGADLVGARVTVCRNDGCSEGMIAAAPSGEGVGYGTTLSGALGYVEMIVEHMGQQFTIEADAYGNDGTLAAGDMYSVAVHASDERLLVEQQWTASYAEVRPNGPDCEPVCTYAMFE